MRKITIVFFDAGGGHRNAAEALRSTLEKQHGWQVTLLNIQDLLDSVDVVRKLSGVRLQDTYNLVLRKGWTRFSPQLLLLLHGLIRACHGRTVKLLQGYWRQHPADLVLSVIPHFNRALAESLGRVLPEAAFATLLTDFADYPPHFWLERESEYVICGTEHAGHQAIDMGHAPEKVFHASGMVMKPRFYNLPAVDRTAERARLGLRPDLPAAVVLFGGHGSPAMVEIARRLEEKAVAVQLIFLCGHSQQIKAALQRMRFSNPVVIEGFTTEVDSYMAIADFFIGKPGPGSISEALQFHLPVILESNKRTLPQERYNAQWVVENRLGIVLKSFKEIAGGVEGLLEPSTFSELRRNAEAYCNRALLEVPQILERVMELHASSAARTPTLIVQPDPLGEHAAWASLGG